jgi:hypothetical protein
VRSLTWGLQIVQLLTEQWNINPPRFFLSISGGLTSYDLPPLLQEKLSKGAQKDSTTHEPARA